MWVADMDFGVPQEVIDALKARAEHGVFGYPMLTASYYDAVIGWMERHYNWSVKREWIYYSPGIIQALNNHIEIVTQ